MSPPLLPLTRRNCSRRCRSLAFSLMVLKVLLEDITFWSFSQVCLYWSDFFVDLKKLRFFCCSYHKPLTRRNSSRCHRRLLAGDFAAVADISSQTLFSPPLKHLWSPKYVWFICRVVDICYKTCYVNFVVMLLLLFIIMFFI